MIVISVLTLNSVTECECKTATKCLSDCILIKLTVKSLLRHSWVEGGGDARKDTSMYSRLESAANRLEMIIPPSLCLFFSLSLALSLFLSL